MSWIIRMPCPCKQLLRHQQGSSSRSFRPVPALALGMRTVCDGRSTSGPKAFADACFVQHGCISSVHQEYRQENGKVRRYQQFLPVSHTKYACDLIHDIHLGILNPSVIYDTYYMKCATYARLMHAVSRAPSVEV